MRVKGKDTVQGIYECFDGDDPASFALKLRTMKEFQKGIRFFFANEFPKASAVFDKVLSRNPEDKVARYFPDKAAECTLAGIPRDQDIVNTMAEK